MTKKKPPTRQEVIEGAERALQEGIPSESEVVRTTSVTGKVKVEVKKIGQNHDVSDKVASFDEFDKEDVLDKRIYRKSGSEDLDDDQKSPRAEVNRLTQLVAARVSRRHKGVFEELTEHFGSKREALEAAIDLLEQELSPEVDYTEEPEL